MKIWNSVIDFACSRQRQNYENRFYARLLDAPLSKLNSSSYKTQWKLDDFCVFDAVNYTYSMAWTKKWPEPEKLADSCIRVLTALTYFYINPEALLWYKREGFPTCNKGLLFYGELPPCKPDCAIITRDNWRIRFNGNHMKVRGRFGRVPYNIVNNYPIVVHDKEE